MFDSPTKAFEHAYPEVRFGGFTDVDGTVLFYTRVAALVDKGTSTVVDVGCGRGASKDDPSHVRRHLRDMRQFSGWVIGLDVNADASENPFINEFRLINQGGWPVSDASIDLCVADFVVEHVEEPRRFFSEAHRILRPGGTLCIRTTNSHGYVGVAARLIPTRLETRILGGVQPKRRDLDIFPKVYRCNSQRRLARMLRDIGFDARVWGHSSEPAYTPHWRLAFGAAVLYHHLVPRRFAPALFAFAEKVSS